ncbi:MAG: universal stress protein [Rhodobiaceae bacterium]|nr:universal stress protein [Rhodobiaceae bacterium]
MHTILVPVDGSIHSLKALRIACDLAEKYDGQIVLVHILLAGRQPGQLKALGVAASFGPNIVRDLGALIAKGAGTAPPAVLRDIGTAILADAEGRVSRRGIPCRRFELQNGDPAEAILLAHRQTGANTIVMGSRGVSDSGESAFGSVSQAVFAQADCTCISVK